METVIDTVEACTLEIGDITATGTIVMIIEFDGYIVALFEDEESKTYDDFELVDIYGMVYADV